MTKYAAGRRFEYEVRDYLKSFKYTVIRAAGSHGLYDLVAWRDNDVLVIQCKKEMKKASYNEDIAKLRYASVPRGWVKQFWIKRDRVSVSVIDVGRFPSEDTVTLIPMKEFTW